MTTAQKIINLLNREALTVSELAAKLDISRNSAHLAVGKLEAAGALEKTHRRPADGAGKPAFAYRTAPGHEDAYSSAYKPVLTGVIQTLGFSLPEAKRIAFFEDAGRTIAADAGLAPTGDLDADVRRSVDAVNALGAQAEVTRRKRKRYVSCHSCPVASLVHKDAQVCRLVAAFFQTATGKRVTVDCRHGDTVVCGFSFD